MLTALHAITSPLYTLAKNNKPHPDFTFLTILHGIRTKLQRQCYVQCFDRKWVNGRLLGVNYVRQTIALTEMLNERYQLMIHSHSCRVSVREHMPAPEQLLSCPTAVFSSVCPM